MVRFVPGMMEAVVVLGCRNAGREANALNRWRVRAAIRSQDRTATRSCLVLCGGAVGGDVSETAVMARYARSRYGVQDLVVADESRTAWENIENVIPLVEGFDRINIVSNPLHARKARLYMTWQRPDLALRLARGAEYRFGEWMPLKVVSPYLAG